MSDASNLYTEQPQSIVMYTTSWCPDCRRAREVFSQTNVPFIDIDVDRDKQAAQFVQKINNGNRSVPTIIFPDGSKLVEPSTDRLRDALKTY